MTGTLEHIRFDDHLDYIPDLIEKHAEKAKDLDWNGDRKKADFHWKQVSYYESRLKDGDEYEAKF